MGADYSMSSKHIKEDPSMWRSLTNSPVFYSYDYNSEGKYIGTYIEHKAYNCFGPSIDTRDGSMARRYQNEMTPPSNCFVPNKLFQDAVFDAFVKGGHSDLVNLINIYKNEQTKKSEEEILEKLQKL